MIVKYFCELEVVGNIERVVDILEIENVEYYLNFGVLCEQKEVVLKNLLLMGVIVELSEIRFDENLKVNLMGEVSWYFMGRNYIMGILNIFFFD